MAGAMSRQSIFEVGELTDMATKKVLMQRFARNYREKHGRDTTSHELALAWKKIGGQMPKPKDVIDILAKEFADAEREELSFDEVLGESYNANICYELLVGDKIETRWADTDTASRDKIVKNAALRRNQVVGDLVRATVTLLHWNRIHPEEEPVQMELDFGPDVEWKLNAPRLGEQAS
jgi:hypothetical protein